MWKLGTRKILSLWQFWKPNSILILFSQLTAITVALLVKTLSLQVHGSLLFHCFAFIPQATASLVKSSTYLQKEKFSTHFPSSQWSQRGAIALYVLYSFILNPVVRVQKGWSKFSVRVRIVVLQDYLLDAPVSVGDGFSFSGGQYWEFCVFGKVVCCFMLLQGN